MPTTPYSSSVEMAMVPCDTVRDVSVSKIVSSALVSVVSVGSVGAEAWAVPRIAAHALKLALSAPSKLVCMRLADLNDVLDLGNQIVVFID